ncbi:protein arginine kinase [Neochlamydia sp. S13]|uniref:protein arginine kinase n=1 Tax=Neochlamydia sp. S13 TaxID=1353976 RepID=UPI0005A73826|nr:protein arginine kinase [Neochlamydia sp. S13]BBI18050.1 Uncharacterized protein NCS13_1_1855 [Neochlamydia sp. S13]
MANNNKSNVIINQKKLWQNNDNDIWLASILHLHRNLEKFNFPGKLSTERRKQVVSVLSKEILSLDLLETATLIRAEEMEPFEKEFLGEHFWSNDNFIQAHLGEAFIIDASGQFLASFNIRNHLHLQLIECKGELEKAWNKLLKIETTIGQNISFAYNAKYGFLTADIGSCGTALLVSIYLQLPALVHTGKMEEIVEKNKEESIACFGLRGSPKEIIGDLLVVQNNYTLGVTEESIISNLNAFATKMVVEENTARNQIRASSDPYIKDKISRAFGILTHSYQIDAIEALNAISLLKLGIEMGWVEGISRQSINQLFFNCRRSHLLAEFHEKTHLPQEEIVHKRAEFIHKALLQAHLRV